jgi:xanthine dehydrogenase YagS FAD-binding subunit
MKSFRYIAATTSQEAGDLVGKKGRYLAGGVDLLGVMKEYIVSPDVVVALRFDPAGEKIRAASEGAPGDLWIDAAATMDELEKHGDLRARFAALAEAAGEVGSPQIRNVATLGGNLLQHSRCWYYRQPDLTCLKRGGETCYAAEGENRYLSIFHGCACVSPAVSNTAVALAALDARLQVRSAHGKTAPLSPVELFAPAWKDPQAHHALAPGDLVLGVTIPAKRTRSAYRQVSEKREFDWALVSCAAAGNVTGGKITDARVALGAVAPGPYVSEAAHDFLEGKTLDDATVSKAADLILSEARPLAHNGYKVPLAHTLIRRTLLALNA